MSWIAGEAETLEFKSFFVRASITLSVMFASRQSALSFVNVPDVGLSGRASAKLRGLLQLIRSQPGLRVAEIAEKTAKPKRTIERCLRQLKARGDIEFHRTEKAVGITQGYRKLMLYSYVKCSKINYE